jgi:hypothetical protein
MKRLWLLVLVLVSFNLLGSQEVQHAPTVELCRADQKLWLSKLEEPGNTSLANVTFYELNGWSKEMSDCEKVDPEFHFRYYNTLGEANSEQVLRLTDFLRRHNLWDQFIAEDLQGKR